MSSYFWVVLKGTKTGVFDTAHEAKRYATSFESKDLRAFTSRDEALAFYREESARRQQAPAAGGGKSSILAREKEKRLLREKEVKKRTQGVEAPLPGAGVALEGFSVSRVPENVQLALQGKAEIPAPSKKRKSFAPRPAHGTAKAAELSVAVVEQARLTVKTLAPRLNEEQKRVADLVASGKNVFFSGSAGAGKSLLLQYVVALLRSKGADEGRGVAVTASTGVAAVNVQGTTLHRFACIGRGEGSHAELLRKVKGSPEQANWIVTRVLVIDEISMVSADLWSALDYIAKAMRGTAGAGKPFGGIQLVVCGDFHQLPPVASGDGEATHWCFESPLWRECFFPPHGESVLLRTIYRQTDAQFLSILAEIRSGEVKPETLALLNSRCVRPLSVQDGIVATKIFPLNRDVDEINKMRLGELVGEERTFVAADRVDSFGETSRPAGGGDTGSNHPLFNSIRMLEKVNLKVGAQVMLLWNVQEQLGLVNGARGVIVGWKPWSPPKTTAAASLIHAWSVRNKEIPVVKFSCQPGLIEVEPREVTAGNPFEVSVSRAQVPLALAWAVTVHKSMGLTLDRASIDLSSAFGDGMVYVALSRVKNLDSLSLASAIPAKAISSSQLVKDFYANFDVGTGGQ